MIKFFLFLILSIVLGFSSRSQSLIFADQFSGGDAQVVQSIAADHDENIFVSIVFYDEVDVDPGPGETKFDAVGSGDLALVKLTSAGEFIWGIQLGGTVFETSKKVVTDEEGSVLVIGYFNSTVDFDPGPATHNLTPAGGQDGFLAKYDGDGNYLWAYQIGSSGGEEFYGLDVDDAGNVYTIGYFQNTIDFDPGPGVTNLSAIGGNSLFFWKLDADGNFIWAKQIAYAYGGDLDVDEDNNLLVAGNFFGTIDFNPGAGTYNLSATGFGYDAYILKLNTDGIFQWAGKMSGAAEESGLSVWADSQTQQIFVGGGFTGTADFDPSNGTSNLTSAGYWDGFVECFNNDGSFVWAKSFGGSGFDEVLSLQTDGNKNIYLSGVFAETCDFDPSNNSYNLTSNGYTDGYIAVWDSNENLTSVFQLGGNLDDWLQQLRMDDEGGILACGQFSSTVDFDPGNDEYSLSTFTGWDGFAAKYCTAYTIDSFISICEGDSIFAGGEWQTEEGDYYDYYDPIVGCDSTIITHISFSHPVVDLGNDTAICGNNTVVLDAGNPGAEYLWSNGDTSQTIQVSETGNFSVTVTDTSGCTANDTIVINQGPVPMVNLGGDIEFCHGEPVILNAGNPGSKYLWSTGDTTKKILVLTGGLYSVTVTNGAGCVGYDTIVVTENPLPVVNLGSDISFCDGDSIELNAGNSGSEFLWSNGKTTQTIFVNADGNYWVKVTNEFGCAGVDTISVTQNLLPVIDLGNNVGFCEGDSVLLDAGNPGSEYLWSSGQTSQTIYASSSSLYSVIVTDNNDCKNADTVEVIVNSLPEVYISGSGDTTVCLSSASMQLPQAFPSGGYYSGDGISENNFNSIIAGVGDHVITYTYTDSLGCINSASFIITVVVCTQVEAFSNDEILIYPNPSSGILVIERGEARTQMIFVTDVSGKILRQIQLFDSPKTVINLTDLPAGIYFLGDEHNTCLQKIFITD